MFGGIKLIINSRLTSREYLTSKEEMNRRKRAFTTLAISLFISISILSIDFLIFTPEIAFPLLLLLSIILIVLRFIFQKSLEKQEYLRIYISNNELEWKFKNYSQKCALSNVKSIRIKRTTRGTIREIRIDIPSKTSLFINGLDRFEQFEEDLINTINKDIKISNFTEPIDFDHPLYYVFFGTLVGIVSNVLFRLLPLISQKSIKYMQFLNACFIVVLGIYWVISKPVTGRYGNRHMVTDYLFGLLMIALGALIIMYSGTLW